MPANLTPEYFQAERRYRAAREPEEKLEALQAMFSAMPKHKGTDRLRAELRTKIARITQETERKYATSRKSGPDYVRREGAGQVVLVGLPNAGKSQLLSAVTEASSAVGEYPFTTKAPIPGMMQFENIQIQVVDVPAVTSREAQSWLGNIFRNADLLLILVDLIHQPASQMQTIREELARRRIRLARDPDKARVEVEGVRTQRALIVGNKNDLESAPRGYRELLSQYGTEFPVLAISARDGAGLDDMKQAIYHSLDIIRVYTKAPGQKPSLEEPVVLRRGSTVEEAAESIHKDLRRQLRYALVWGSGKFDGQRVKRGHILEEGDIIEIHT